MGKFIFCRVVIMCNMLVLSALAKSQTSPDSAFLTFVKQQESLYTVAYNQRDVKEYHALLDAFVRNYNSLNSGYRQQYKGYLANLYYNLSCTYALLNNKSRSLEYLGKAIKSGYNNYTGILGDADLQMLRDDVYFKALVQPLRQTGDYLYIIKKAAIYNPDDKRPVPVFSYQTPDNPNLVALRKAFNLDSIAGAGTDVSKILNLMHWLHNMVPHDGNHENPAIKNAMSLLAVCKNEGRGLNCRGLATVLNECYLSLGFKSRFVTCLPKDSLGVDNDCHVINMVFAPSLKKWLWMDPTFDSYVMNENGELLGIEEVRERIINDKPLIISPDANWNHKVSETKQYYLFYYMAKNLYRLQCPANSEYDLETVAAGKKIEYVNLLPLDYFRQPTKAEWVNPANKATTTNYYTNNPAYFWQTPQSN